jgi:hypothetical protein
MRASAREFGHLLCPSQEDAIMNTADNTTDEGVDVVDMLIQLLVRQ